MEVKQIYNIVNDVTKEILGETDIVTENLENVVDIGTEIFSATSVDNYVRTLVDHIGKVIFVNRPYAGIAPRVLMDSWEFGSVLEKISVDLPEAVENESWELNDNQQYVQDVFKKPKVSAKFFNKRVTFDIDISITDRQVKGSFSSLDQLNSFLSMIYNAVDKSLTVKIDGLVMRAINNMIGETIHNEIPESTNYSTTSTVKAVNLLKLYNDKFGTSLTVEKCMNDKEFLRYASGIFELYKSRMARISTLFNVGGKDRFTPSDMLHVILLADFKVGANTYLQSDTFNDEFTALPNAEVVPYWQGSGTDYSFNSISDIHINTASGNEVSISGIIGVMFDRDALGVSCLDRRVTAHYNAKAEFTNNFYKFDAGYFNDLNENFVVFFVA